MVWREGGYKSLLRLRGHPLFYEPLAAHIILHYVDIFASFWIDCPWE